MVLFWTKRKCVARLEGLIMRISINSKVFGECSFWMSDNGGYIYLEDKGEGTTGSQICKGGEFMGDTLSARGESGFEKQVRRWHRARLSNRGEF
jgi:hypothetical protein